MADYNHVQLVFDRDNLSPGEDVAVCTMHIREVVQGAPDILPVTDEGRQDFVADITEFWTGVQSSIWQGIELREARFYEVPDTPGQHMGDPILVHPFNLPGTGTSGSLPPQIAMSVTFRTDKRLQWGRFYLPGVGVAHIGGDGRWDSLTANTILSATHALTRRSGTGAALVVFSRKQWTHHDPQVIQIDDIPDVIRSRRYEKPLFRHTLSAG